jgi:hypothetical protein
VGSLAAAGATLARTGTTRAPAGTTLAAALQGGTVAWLDPRSGKVLRTAPTGGTPVVVAGGGAVWAFDAATARAWRLAAVGVLDPPVRVAGAVQVAPNGAEIWWTTRDGALLGSRPAGIDLGAVAGEPGGLVVCAGSVWLSVARGLARANAWSAEAGAIVPAPIGPVPFLACAGGALVGGSGPYGLFVLDPSVDAGARKLDADLGGDLGLLVATTSHAWAFAARRAEVRLVRLRREA